MKNWQDMINESEKIVEVDVERLKPFRDLPFSVKDDLQMEMLTESIRQYGILNPVIARITQQGAYEIISGHRRIYAAKHLGYRKIPVMIKTLSDSEAVICMVDSNIQREHIPHSEKAFAYKMKNEAMKKLRCVASDRELHDKLKGRRTVDILGTEFGDSSKQVQRYIKLTELIPELLKKLDEGEIAFCPAVEIAYLKPQEQSTFFDVMDYTQAMPSLSQAQRIRELSRKGQLTFDAMAEIMEEIKKGEPSRVMFKNEQIRQYFPRKYTPEMMKREILEILKQRMTTYREQEEEICVR